MTESTSVETTSTQPLSATPRTILGRKKARAVTDRPALHEVLDAGLICHLGLVIDHSPVVLPTGYGRDGDTLYLHGSTGARTLIAASEGIDLCVTVTLTDGIVYSRAVHSYSMNYRSAVVYGRAEPVTDPAAKTHGLRVLTEHLAPGSWEHSRPVNAKEFAGVSLLALDLAEASLKVRSGGPNDDPEDIEVDAAWAGVLPIHTTFGAPIPAADLSPGFPTPAHIANRTYEGLPMAWGG